MFIIYKSWTTKEKISCQQKLKQEINDSVSQFNKQLKCEATKFSKARHHNFGAR